MTNAMCIICGRAFAGQRNQKCCWSKECTKGYGKYKRSLISKRHELVCVICGETFIGNTNGQKTCSKECRRIHENGKNKGYMRRVSGYIPFERICTVCGSVFFGKKNSKVCNKDCRKEYKRKYDRDWSRKTQNYKPRLPAEHVCIICKETFIGGKNQKVCSSECRNEYKKLKSRESMRKLRTDPETRQEMLAKTRSSVKKWRKKYPEKRALQRKRHHELHREEENEKTRARNGVYYYEHHEEVLERQRKNKKVYRKSHPSESSRYQHKRLGLVFDLKPAEWDEIYEHFNHACAYCGAENDNMHRDHFIPISRGGGYTMGNIVPACPRCNINKSNKHPLEWLIIKEHGLIVFVKVAQYLGYM